MSDFVEALKVDFEDLAQEHLMLATTARASGKLEEEELQTELYHFYRNMSKNPSYMLDRLNGG